MKNKITIGTDPELFIVNTKTDKIVSAINLIPGEKNNAYRPEGFEEGYGLQIDNILAEFNVPPVLLSEEDLFVRQINRMKDYIRDYVQKVNPDYDILCQASAFVDEKLLDNPIAKLFGCDPDYNVYTGKCNEKPKGDKTNLRTTGMHIHVGYPDYTINESLMMIKYMDLYLGVPSIVMDTDTKRRELYGKAGCFRLTDYGFEYRTLSGHFISSDETIRFVFRQTTKALTAYYQGQEIPSDLKVQTVINTGDVATAKLMIAAYDIL